MFSGLKVIFKNNYNSLKEEKINYILLLLLLVGVIIYIKFINNPFVYDDINQVLQNTKIQNIFKIKDVIFCELRQIRFFQNITFAIDFLISKDLPWPFRVQNLFWHFICCFYLIKIINIFNKLSFKNYLILITLFTFIPIQVQNIHYVMARTTLLIAFFYIYISYLVLIDSSKFKIIICLLLSTLAKETAVFIPFIMLAIDLFVKDQPITKSLVKNYLFYFSSVLIGMLITYSILKDPSSMYYNVTGFYLFPMHEYVIAMIYYIGFYFYLFLNPYHLSIVHDFPVINNEIYIYALISIILFSVFTYFVFKKRKKHKEIFIFYCIWIINWLPMHSFMQFINPFAEYRLYLINIVSIYMVYRLFELLFERFNLDKKLFDGVLVFYLVYSLCFFYFNLNLYSRHLKLYGYALELYPNSPRLNLIIAEYYTNHRETNFKEKLELEESYYKKAYDLYQIRKYPSTMAFDLELMGFYRRNKRFEEMCNHAVTMSIFVNIKIELITYYGFLVECIKTHKRGSVEDLERLRKEMEYFIYK